MPSFHVSSNVSSIWFGDTVICKTWSLHGEFVFLRETKGVCEARSQLPGNEGQIASGQGRAEILDAWTDSPRCHAINPKKGLHKKLRKKISGSFLLF
jgi:hypothetical protein